MNITLDFLIGLVGGLVGGIVVAGTIDLRQTTRRARKVIAEVEAQLPPDLLPQNDDAEEDDSDTDDDKADLLDRHIKRIQANAKARRFYG